MVTIIGDIGFCFGVDHAIGVLRKAAQENKKVYLTHPLLHNKVENDALLRENHAHVFTDKESLFDSAVVFSAHGHAPQEEEKYSLAHLYDATCPLILKRYEEISRQKDIAVVFLGKKGHQETEAFLARFPSFLFVDSRKDIVSQLSALALNGKTGLVPQTTISKSAFETAFSWLSKNTDLAFCLPICPMYEKRFRAVVDFFKGKDPNDYFLVVCGDTLSSNANELLKASIKELPGLKGDIAMNADTLGEEDVGKRKIVLCSSTSASAEKVLRLKEQLEKRFDNKD